MPYAGLLRYTGKFPSMLHADLLRYTGKWPGMPYTGLLRYTGKWPSVPYAGVCVFNWWQFTVMTCGCTVWWPLLCVGGHPGTSSSSCDDEGGGPGRDLQTDVYQQSRAKSTNCDHTKSLGTWSMYPS